MPNNVSECTESMHARNLDHALAGFEKHFGCTASRTYFSPGRVNLIGEYTDFNGGYVLPSAIDRGTFFAVRANDSQCINVYSDAFDSKATILLRDAGDQVAEHAWSDYVKGALLEFVNRSLLGNFGLDIHVSGNLPQNSGLSSSASFTVGMLFLLNDIWDSGLDRMDLVHMARSVENNFVGLQCGIMDQYAVANGRAQHAICLHCHTLEASLIPFRLDGHEIVITDSRVPRKLSESQYNQRRLECDSALAALRTGLELDFLCAASITEIENCDALIANPVARKRVRHVVTENERVQLSVRLLRENRLAAFGELMYASHDSLRDDFAVSCKELDILVDLARVIPGVLGSRMTGAGFGGCTVSIVEAGAIPNFVTELSAAYSRATPYQANILRCRTSDGVKRL